MRIEPWTGKDPAHADVRQEFCPGRSPSLKPEYRPTVWRPFSDTASGGARLGSRRRGRQQLRDVVKRIDRTRSNRSRGDAEKLSPMHWRVADNFRAEENSESRQADTDRHRRRSKRDTTGISSRADVPDVAGKQTQAAVHSVVASASERQARPDRRQPSASTIAEASELSQPARAETQARAYYGKAVHDRAQAAAPESPDQRAVSSLSGQETMDAPFQPFPLASDSPTSHRSSRQRLARRPVAGSTRRTLPR